MCFASIACACDHFQTLLFFVFALLSVICSLIQLIQSPPPWYACFLCDVHCMLRLLCCVNIFPWFIHFFLLCLLPFHVLSLSPLFYVPLVFFFLIFFAYIHIPSNHLSMSVLLKVFFLFPFSFSSLNFVRLLVLGFFTLTSFFSCSVFSSASPSLLLVLPLLLPTVPATHPSLFFDSPFFCCLFPSRSLLCLLSLPSSLFASCSSVSSTLSSCESSILCLFLSPTFFDTVEFVHEVSNHSSLAFSIFGNDNHSLFADFLGCLCLLRVLLLLLVLVYHLRGCRR